MEDACEEVGKFGEPDDERNTHEDLGANNVEGSESSSSSSSSSSEDEDAELDDVTDKMVASSVPVDAITGTSWNPSATSSDTGGLTRSMQGPREATLRVSFVGGRSRRSEFSRFTGTIHTMSARGVTS